MTPSPPPPDQLPHNYTPPYRNPRPAYNLTYSAQLLLGFFVLLVFALLLYLLTTINFSFSTSSDSYFTLALYTLLICLAALNIFALIFWRWPGFPIGSLLGIGCVFLLLILSQLTTCIGELRSIH